MKRSNHKYVGGIYRLIEKIDQGTFGKIFRGINEHTQEPVAIKIVYYFINSQEDKQLSRSLLLREAQIYTEIGGARKNSMKIFSWYSTNILPRCRR